ncbi:NAD(P)-binding protein [Aureobasidium pullulans EXF-150]|uniref:NAD(P)-binding protein n=1 Tax=Aureobasidium pullulans EXF-150 TaxID=1043002 RepID=A0A074X083_AURPU|nr:NAD(P)-binding protein [Aureobasidium pullulans EXF-150]KEQ78828.1 NAD(P)-binding protein [Aureobasidium pullulans EXF-150]THY99139.1 NAD(P)-binding protein [Aureobasidium pullulans]
MSQDNHDDQVRPDVDAGTVLVTGGSGGLGHQIITMFSTMRESSRIHSVDLRAPVKPLESVQYHQTDLTDEIAIRTLFDLVKPAIVIHCASPRYDASMEVMRRINVEGTKLLVDIAKASGTKAFIYTSSASVISDGKTDLKGADESYPLIIGEAQPEYYVNTKALAEMYVLSQNQPTGTPRFLTCALRPSGIFGVGDSWVVPGILEAYHRGQTWVQLGDNTNLFEFTENTNVAYAHVLATAALVAAYAKDNTTVAEDKVDGEAFFITNDEPVYFWDFTRTIWKYAGDTTKPEHICVVPRSWAMGVAFVLEWVYWALWLGNPPLTRTKVRLSCMTRYYSITKAKQRLGYKPVVGMREGLRRAVEDCLRREIGLTKGHLKQQ